jgi:hypothetical protein
MKNRIILIPFLFLCALGLGQSSDSTLNKPLQFTGDFKFRAEHDWDVRKPDGSYQADRTRFRYRFRLGLTYQLTPSMSIGTRIRTGDPIDQQGQPVTLGGQNGEFAPISLAFDKLYFKYKHRSAWAWVGKNTYPFWKQHEVFWGDAVNPDGLAAGFEKKITDDLTVHPVAGIFIEHDGNGALSDDAVMAAFQFQLTKTGQRHTLKSAPGIFHFNDLAFIPDGKDSFLLNYSLVNLSAEWSSQSKLPVAVGADVFYNLQEYSGKTEIASYFRDQKTGWTAKVSIGDTKSKGDWMVSVIYAYVQKFSIVDYFAQNDWTRWTYPNSPAARLSNFQGAEFTVGYKLTDAVLLSSKMFVVKQLVADGNKAKETGSRFRIDLDAKF